MNFCWIGRNFLKSFISLLDFRVFYFLFNFFEKILRKVSPDRVDWREKLFFFFTNNIQNYVYFCMIFQNE